METIDFLIRRYCKINLDNSDSEESKAYVRAYYVLLKQIDPLRAVEPKAYQALPFKPSYFGWYQFINTFSLIGYTLEKHVIDKNGISQLKLPCVIKQGKKIAILYQDKNNLMCYDPFSGKSNKYAAEQKKKIITYVPVLLELKDQDIAPETCQQNGLTWFKALTKRFRSSLSQLLFVTFFLHILSLSIPIYIITVYDKVINANQLQALYPITFCIIFVLLCAFILRFIRSIAISNLSCRVDYIVNTAIVDKIFNFPSSVVDSASIVSTLAKIRSFSTLRDFFSGPIFLSCIEIPFVIIMIVALGFINIYLIIIPIVAIMIFAILMFLFCKINKEGILGAAIYKTKRQKILSEFVEKIHNIKYTGLNSHFQNMLNETELEYMKNVYRSEVVSAVADSISRGVTLFAAFFTLLLGVHLIWSFDLSIGGLIAALFLIWRILNPVQTLTVSFARIEKLKRGIGQINAFMKAKTENDAPDRKHHFRKCRGDILLENLTILHSSRKSFLFKNVSIHIEPGQFVVITGKSGSGKSTLLKVINGLLFPDSGTVKVDGISLQHSNLRSLHDHVHYISQSPQLMSGTIYDNLSLYSPYVTKLQAEEALKRVNASEEISKLEKGMDTYITSDKAYHLSNFLVYQICLARVYIHDKPIILIDNLPNYLFEGSAGEFFIDALSKWQGKKTIVMVNYRTDFIKMADQVINLHRE